MSTDNKTPTRDHPFDIIKKRAQEAEQRLKKASEINSEIHGDSQILANEIQAELDTAPTQRTLVTHTVIREMEAHIFRGEQMGLFETYPIKPSTEFPSLLCRLPIFLASRQQQKYLDKDYGLRFDTPFGKGRRLGPPLTVKDEDVLMALGRLRSKRLTGPHDKLPIGVPKEYLHLSQNQTSSNNSGLVDEQGGKVVVDTLFCTVAHILVEMNMSLGGGNYKSVIDSIRRLAGASIELSVNKKERYFGEMEMGRPFRLIDIEWVLFEQQGLIMVQFTPVMVRWFIKEYSYVDWNIRRQLKTEAAKAIHKYLSSQNRHMLPTEIEKIAKTTGITLSKNRLKGAFEHCCEQLCNLGWLESYIFTGTGRRVSHKLETWRKRRQ
jgi:hypothetical protein